MYSTVGSQFFSQPHKPFVLSLQIMAVNAGITFCQPRWIAGEVTLQHRNTVTVGIEIVCPVTQFAGRIQLLAKGIILLGNYFKTATGCSINIFSLGTAIALRIFSNW